MEECDECCTVCGGPPYIPFLPPSPDPADYTWLQSSIGVSNKEELIPLDSYGSWGDFDVQADTSPYTVFTFGCRNDDFYENAAHGYACHVTCYNLLQQELNYTLKYADVLPLLVDNDEYSLNTFSWCDYGGLAEYHGQFFDQDQFLKDGKLWMIKDPSRNGENKERILQVWRPLVESGFKRPDGRVGDGSRAPEIAEVNIDESRV